MTNSEARARLEFTLGGRVARVLLAAPRANIVDLAMMADLDDLRARLAGRRDLAAIVLTAEGPDFSFGASIEEHLPDQIADALGGLHRLIRDWLKLPAPTVAAVRGQCLGGGLELALACDLIVAERSARLGTPEIKLGVFPPAASALLPVKIGAARAAELLLTGAAWSAERAAESGLVTVLAEEGELDATLDAWLERHLLERSPTALGHACRAARRPLLRAVYEDLPDLEGHYLDRLMREPDATEGIEAFLEKRPPRWSALEPSQ